MIFSEIDFLIALCLLLGAVLYTSVGHAGASAYIAIMALFSLPAAVIKPTALVLNILVASFTTFRYVRKGFFDFSLLLPLAIGALPAAFLGGYIQAPTQLYKALVGLILLYSAYRMIRAQNKGEHEAAHQPVFLQAVAVGAGIGFLAGLTGTGGGIFLSPVILFFAWSTTRNSLGTASAFILINSVSGLLGNLSSIKSLPDVLPLFLAAVFIGALIGTAIGSKYASVPMIRKLLGLVLLIAGLKLVWTAFG